MTLDVKHRCKACGYRYEKIEHRRDCERATYVAQRDLYGPTLRNAEREAARYRTKSRTVTLTAEGRKTEQGCDGVWPEPCRDAWPVSRFAWCRSCQRSYPARSSVGGTEVR